MNPRFFASPSVIGALLAALGGCESNVAEKLALAKLAQSCLVNSDCSSPLVCAFQACHAECESSRDCDPGARCVAAARPYKVCQLEEERACQRSSDCAEGLVCGIDDECRDQCLTENDCVEGQQCVSGTCADANELDESGALAPAPGKEAGGEGAPCVYVSDCAGALLCRGQACLPQCRADRDCDVNEVCHETRCVADGTQPRACAYHSDCATDSGERCLGGGCRCMCAEARDCAEGQTCDGCGCVARPGHCDYDSDCEAAGQICRNGACACQCRGDADCGEARRCDGCGCVPVTSPLDGIIYGHVTIDSTLQLPLYRGVTEIQGSLYFNSAFIADLGDTFDELRLVQGSVLLSGNGHIRAVRFPKLVRAAWLTLSSNPQLETLALPAFEEGQLALANLNTLKELDLRAWRKGGLSAHGLSQLKDLSLPALSEADQLEVSEGYGLERVSLPELTAVHGGFTVSTQSTAALVTLSAPKLKVLGDGVHATYVSISGTRLESLSGFGAEGWKVTADGLQLWDNSQLGTCAVEAFTKRFMQPDAPFVPSIGRNLDDCTTCAARGESCVVN